MIGINMGMRYTDIINESVTSPDAYYHGTALWRDAQSIIANGLKPPEISTTKTRTNLAPQKGYVYLTPNLRYAIGYAIGFRMMENDRLKLRIPYEGNEQKFKWVTKEHGRYGFVFKVNASTIQKDLQPDEDVVGTLFSAAMFKNNIHFYLEDFLPKNVLDAAKTDQQKFDLFIAYVKKVVSEATIKKLINEYQNSDQMISWASKVGKIALRKMPLEMKLWLVKIGCHVGHAGILIPDECWKFDRTKFGWLEPDASNFFELADRIK